MSKVKPDSRKPGQAYMITNLGNVVLETPVVKHANELYTFLQNCLDCNNSGDLWAYMNTGGNDLMKQIKLSQKAGK